MGYYELVQPHEVTEPLARYLVMTRARPRRAEIPPPERGDNERDFLFWRAPS